MNIREKEYNEEDEFAHDMMLLERENFNLKCYLLLSVATTILALIGKWVIFS